MVAGEGGWACKRPRSTSVQPGGRRCSQRCRSELARLSLSHRSSAWAGSVGRVHSQLPSKCSLPCHSSQPVAYGGGSGGALHLGGDGRRQEGFSLLSPGLRLCAPTRHPERQNLAQAPSLRHWRASRLRQPLPRGFEGLGSLQLRSHSPDGPCCPQPAPSNHVSRSGCVQLGAEGRPVSGRSAGSLGMPVAAAQRPASASRGPVARGVGRRPCSAAPPYGSAPCRGGAGCAAARPRRAPQECRRRRSRPPPPLPPAAARLTHPSLFAPPPMLCRYPLFT